MTKKKLPKINRRRAAGSGSGYSHDNACVAFGDVREIKRRYESTMINGKKDDLQGDKTQD
jgi:hypothetical protein